MKTKIGIKSCYIASIKNSQGNSMAAWNEFLLTLKTCGILSSVRCCWLTSWDFLFLKDVVDEDDEEAVVEDEMVEAAVPFIEKEAEDVSLTCCCCCGAVVAGGNWAIS